MTTYAVCLLSADGNYPATPIVLDQRGVLLAEDCAWYAVLLTPGGLADEWSEITWLTPDEIRFVSAVYLAEPDPWNNGHIYLLTQGHTTLEFDEPITSGRLIVESRLAAQQLRSQGPEGHRPYTIDCDYTGEATRLLDHMDPSSALLHRGLYKLVIAKELARERKFMEESMLAAVTSREAALELLRRKFSAFGERWTRDHVLLHIEETFPTGEAFVEVLLEDWAARTIIAHPVSEYGEFWTPPIDVDQCLEAIDTLNYLYRYLLLDEITQPPPDGPKDIDPRVEANTDAIIAKLDGPTGDQ